MNRTLVVLAVSLFFGCGLDTPGEELASQEEALTYVPVNRAVVEDLMAKVQPANLQATVTQLGQFHNRYYRSQSGRQAADWLFQSWRTIASTSRTAPITVEQFTHPNWAQKSIVVTIPGMSTGQPTYVLSAHLDSINGLNPMNGRAPGADDGGAGVAVLTEVLRILASSPYRPERPIRLIAYAASEGGLLGSREIANRFKADRVVVAGVVDFFLVGYPNRTRPGIAFIQDHTHATLTAFLDALVATFLPGVPRSKVTCGYACGDFASWTAAGFAAASPFESSNLHENSTINTEGDTVVDANHIARFTKLGLAFLGEQTRLRR